MKKSTLIAFLLAMAFITVAALESAKATRPPPVSPPPPPPPPTNNQ